MNKVICYLLTWTKQPVATSSVKLTHAQLLKLDPGLCEVVKELLLVLGIFFDNLSHLWILDQSQIRRKHHQAASLILVLQGSSPRLALVGSLGSPLLLQQQPVELIGESRRCKGPLYEQESC